MVYEMPNSLLCLENPQIVAFVLGQVPTSLKIYIAIQKYNSEIIFLNRFSIDY